MASPFLRADAEVDYPLYAVDFDPEDASRIVIGGGGGVGRSGVPNKIVRTPVIVSSAGPALGGHTWDMDRG